MNVTFEEQGPIARTTPSNGQGLAAWMVRKQIVDTISHAQTVLLVAVVIIFGTAAVIGASAMSHKEIDTHKNFVPAVVR